MTEPKRVAAGVAAAALAIGAHASGALRVVEREFSPALAAKSFDMFDVSASGAGSALQQLARGNSNEQAVARAACTVLQLGMTGSRSQEQWESSINAQLGTGLTSEDQLQPIVDSLSNRLAFVQDYPALYRDVCVTKY